MDLGAMIPAMRNLYLSFFLAALIAPLQASPEAAERVKRGYELTMEKWTLKNKLATTPAERAALSSERPDPFAAAAEIYRVILPSLKETWTLPYSAFFLETSQHLVAPNEQGVPAPAYRKERDRLSANISLNHSKAPEIAPVCIAWAASNNAQNLPYLEKVASENPDKGTQGIAALGSALLLKTLGDDPEIMKRRLGYLRTAIIQASEKSIYDRSVADIATDELFTIRYLSKGRTAPPLSGTDVSGRAVSLSDFKGKITVLLFWDAQSPNTDQVINLNNQLVEKFRDQAVTVLGVTPEPLDRIRALQADGQIKWNNLIDPSEKLSAEYRITSRPTVFIIDSTGTIQYTGLPGSFVELTIAALLTKP